MKEEMEKILKLDFELPENNFDFKALRKHVGFTLRKVEDLTGISNCYLSQLENKKITNPSYQIVRTLINLYHKQEKKKLGLT